MGGNMSSDQPPKKVMNFSFHVESGGAINIFPDSPPPLPNGSSPSPVKEITYPSPPPPRPSPDSFSRTGDTIPKKDITCPSPPPRPSPGSVSRPDDKVSHRPDDNVSHRPDDNIPKKDISYPSPCPSPYSVSRSEDNIPKKEITHPSPPDYETPTRKDTKSSDTCAVMNPGVFSDFGKQANDLLTKDYYNKDMNENFLSLGTHSNAGVDLTLTPLKKNDTTSSTIDGLSIDDLTLIYKSKNNNKNSIHLKINAVEDGVNCFSTTTQVQYELVPDIMNVFMSMEYPYLNRVGGGSKFGGQYFIPDANLNVTASTTLGHDQSPILEGSATIAPSFAIGGDVVSDSKKSENYYRAGIRLTNLFFDDFSVVVSDDKTLKCSSVQYIDSMKKSYFVAELKKSFLNDELPTVTMGTSFEVDHHLKEEMKTVVKAKIAVDHHHHMKMGVVLKQHMVENRILKICSEFDLMALNKTPKIGLSLVL